MGERFFVFQLVDEATTQQLVESQGKEEASNILADVIRNYLYSLQEANEEIDFRYKRDIVIDLLYSALQFAIEQSFNLEKTSCVIELTYRVFKQSMEKPLSFEKSFDLCKQYIQRHSLFRPPHSIILFSLNEIKAILHFFRWNVLRNYQMLLKAFTPETHYGIETFTMFKMDLPKPEGITQGEFVNKDDFAVLDMFNKDKEIKLTKEELEDIMRGNSIHNLPEWKRQEIIRKQMEQERQEKINRVMAKELAKLQQQFEEGVSKQDEDFEKRLSEIKPKK